MILKRKTHEFEDSESTEPRLDAVQSTTEQDQTSREGQTTSTKPLTTTMNWLNRNANGILALGVIASLLGNAYTVTKVKL